MIGMQMQCPARITQFNRQPSGLRGKAVPVYAACVRIRPSAQLLHPPQSRRGYPDRLYLNLQFDHFCLRFAALHLTVKRIHAAHWNFKTADTLCKFIIICGN